MGNPFKPGDLADHVSGNLDPRPVESVEGDSIRLRIGTLVSPLYPAKNYRRIPQRGAAPETSQGGDLMTNLNAALEQIRDLVDYVMVPPVPSDIDHRHRDLAEKVQALDEHLSRGGPLPDAWAYGRDGLVR